MAFTVDALTHAVVAEDIPTQDYEFLSAIGASAIFGQGTVIPVAAGKIVEELRH